MNQDEKNKAPDLAEVLKNAKKIQQFIKTQKFKAQDFQNLKTILTQAFMLYDLIFQKFEPLFQTIDEIITPVYEKAEKVNKTFEKYQLIVDTLSKLQNAQQFFGQIDNINKVDKIDDFIKDSMVR